MWSKGLLRAFSNTQQISLSKTKRKKKFSDEGKLREFVTNRSILKEWLREFLQTGKKKKRFQKRILRIPGKKEERTTETAKILVSTTDFPSLFPSQSFLNIV